VFHARMARPRPLLATMLASGVAQARSPKALVQSSVRGVHLDTFKR